MKKISLKSIVKQNLNIAILIAVLSSPVGLLRILGQYWAGQYHKVLIPMATINSLFGLFFIFYSAKLIKFDFIGTLLVLFFLYGTLLGFLNSGELRYFVSHFLGMLFMLSVYIFSYNSSFLYQVEMAFIQKSAYWIFFSALFTIFFFWFLKIFWNPSLYLGIGPTYLVLSLSFFVVKRKHLFTFLTIILLLITGKRGPILAGFAIITLYYCIPLLQLKIISILKTLLIISFFLFVLLYFYDVYFEAIEEISIISGPLNKLMLVNPYLDNYDPDLAYSGRNEELNIAFKKFNSSNFFQFFGMGYGWSYYFDADITGAETTNFFVHYVHVGPLNFLFQYGYLLFFPFIIGFLLLVFKFYFKKIISGLSDLKVIIGLFLIGDFVNSLSGYMYPINPLFWILLAYASHEKIFKQ